MENTLNMIERHLLIDALSPEFVAGKKLCEPAVNLADHRNFADRQATIGTIVHARIDAHIRGKKFDPAPYFNRECMNPLKVSQTGFDAFLEWAAQTKFKLGEAEVQLVSKKYNYGGTPDVFVVQKQSNVGDFKTGKLYPESLLPQLAAYRNLLRENKYKVGDGAQAMSIDKESGGFTHRYFTPAEVDKGWEVFVKMNDLFHAMKEIKG